VTVSSGKGGVGKTTTTLARAALLGADQHRHGLGTPVVLDLDPRSDATRGVGIQPGGNRYERLFAGALNGIATESLAQMEVHTEEGFAIIPGSPETAFLEARQFSVAGADDAARRRLRALYERRLAIIDTAPGFDRALTRGAIGAADVLIIPFIPEPFAADGALDVLDVVRTFPDADPTVMTLATMVEARRTLTGTVLEDIAKRGYPVDATVPNAVAAAEAPWQGKSVVAYAPKSPVTREYEKAAEHIIAIAKPTKKKA
jgi:cellulose biosynthesis protein BcsQ